jgi:hypothetical protein
MGARNRPGIGLSYRPARLHRLAELIPWNRFQGFINVEKYGLWSLDWNPLDLYVSGLQCNKEKFQIDLVQLLRSQTLPEKYNKNTCIYPFY